MADYIDKVNFYNEGGGLQKSVPIQENTSTLPILSVLRKGGKIAFIGDSIAAGYGWNTGTKTTENDGISAVWREKFPDCTINNFAINQTNISSSVSGKPHIEDQLPNIDSSYDMVVISCGINDIVNAASTPSIFGVSYSRYQNTTENDFSSTIKGICSVMNYIKNKNNNTVVVWILPPTSYYNTDVSRQSCETISYICQNNGSFVFNMQSMYFNYYMDFGKYYLYDQVHPNEKGYRLMADMLVNFCPLSLYNYGNILYIPADIDRSSVHSFINSLLKLVRENIAKFEFTETRKSFMIYCNNSVLLFLDISQIEGTNVLFEFYNYGYNISRFIVEYNQTLKKAVFLGLTPNNSLYTGVGNVTSLESIVTPGDYIISASNEPSLLTMGFTSYAYVYAKCGITYVQWGNEGDEVRPFKNFILTQPSNNIMVNYISFYNISDGVWSGTLNKRYTKYTGEVLSI